jgi:KDO2-lipid IV(A) lauroyltransferase
MSVQNNLVRAALRLLAAIPYRHQSILAKPLLLLAWQSRSSIRRTIETNIGLCFPQLDTQQQQQLAYQATHNFITTALAMPRNWLHFQPDDPAVFAGIEGKEVLDAALSQGKGVIFVTPHMGFWEFFLLQISSLYPVSVLCNNVDEFAPGQINDIIHAARTKSGADILEAKPGVKRRCEQILQQGGIVIIPPDQIPGDKRTYLFADFFGQPAPTMTLIPILARSSGATLVTGFAQRRNDGRYCLVIRAFDEESAIHGSNLQEGVRAMNRAVESLIREAPEQYLWTYRRFRLGPEGRRKIYR